MTATEYGPDGRDEYGDKPWAQHYELAEGEMEAIQAAKLAPSTGPTLEQIGAQWRAQIAAERTRMTDVTCHPGRDMGWTCVAEGCGRLMCDWCDGADNGSGLCWTCYLTEDDGDVA